MSNPQYGFSYLEPTKLPAGVKIVGKRIDVFGEGGKIFGVDAEINLRPVDWVYAIQESRYKADEDVTITAQHSFNPTSAKPTCSQEQAPTLSYRLCHWIDYGKISVYEVKFVQNGTYIDARIPFETNSQIPLSALSSFVDSFVPAKPPTDIVSGI